MADDDVRVPAGWYPDPLGLPQLRWWDNHAWTEHTSDARQPMVAETVTAASPTRLAYADDDEIHDDNIFDLDEGADDGLTRRERRERERLDIDSDGDRADTGATPVFVDPLLSLEAPAPAEVIPEEPSPASRFAETHVLDDAPTSGAYDLGVRYDDLLGDAAGATSTPRSAFAHISESATSFVPDHGPEPMYSGYAGRVTTAIEHDDVDTTTGPAWVMTLIPVYTLMVGLLMLLSGSAIKPTILALVILYGIPHVIGIVLAVLDHRILQHRGMDRPAHWLWSILGAPVYLIARLTRTVRVSGQGFGPLITLLTLGAVSIGAALAAPGLVIQLNPGYFSVEAQQSVRNDAEVLRIELQCCPYRRWLAEQFRSGRLDAKAEFRV